MCTQFWCFVVWQAAVTMLSIHGYILCHCDTVECQAAGLRECKAEFYCYTVFQVSTIRMDSPKIPAGLTDAQRTRSVVVSRGCVANGFMDMCAKLTNRIASSHISRLRTQCCRDAWCNTGEGQFNKLDVKTQSQTSPRSALSITAGFTISAETLHHDERHSIEIAHSNRNLTKPQEANIRKFLGKSSATKLQVSPVHNLLQFASPIPIFLGTTLVVVFLVLLGLVIMCWYQRQRVFLLKLGAQHPPSGPAISNYAALMPSRISSAPVTSHLSEHARSRCCPCCNLFQRTAPKHLYDYCAEEDSANHVTGQSSKLRNPIRVLNGPSSDPISTAHQNTSKWVQTQQLIRHKEPIHHPNQSNEATQTTNDLAVGNIMWQNASDSGTDQVRFSRPSLTTNYSDELGQTNMYIDGNVGFDPHTRAYITGTGSKENSLVSREIVPEVGMRQSSLMTPMESPRQRGTGTTNSMGEDSKRSNREQPMGGIDRSANVSDREHEKLVCLSSRNSRGRQKTTEQPFIALTHFRRAQDTSVELVTPYAQIELNLETEFI
ncbi:hypothetical protein EG68_01022 [Paragonimus skrjabini miyazakii]|uniref:Uncharacterized protein n=1 Tax=Paragonimus skrjabini miyazakii TaxID=59628 RepID=A0A8S9Z3Z3_9TREM|nr:hypothetical protein EG68_01022 [Paragonimus skrjabini miyazakii]